MTFWSNFSYIHLDDILNINSVYCDNMVSQIYPSELQLNKASTSDTEAPVLDLHLSISNNIVTTILFLIRSTTEVLMINDINHFFIKKKSHFSYSSQLQIKFILK